MLSDFRAFLLNAEKFLLFLVVLFLPTQLGKHFWPEWSFVYSLRIDYLSPVLYFWDLLVFALIGIWIISWKVNKKGTSVNQYYLLIFLFFLLTQSLSVINALNPQAVFLRLYQYFVAGLFGLYLASNSFTKLKRLFFLGITLNIIFICSLAILQFLLGHSIGFWVLGERSFSVNTPLIARFTFYEDIFLRPYATFPHPNMLAAYLVLTLPLINYGIHNTRKKLKLLLTLLSTSTLFATFSRPGFILIFFQVALMFRKYWKILLILGVLIAPLVFVRLTSIFTFDSLAVSRREELSEYGLTLFSRYPIFGVGLNNFINILASEKLLIGSNRFLQPVHNIFLYTLSETGIIGFTGFVGLLLAAFVNNLKAKTSLSRVLIGNLLMIIFFGLFDHYFLTLPQGQRTFFIIVGLSLMKGSALNNSLNIPKLGKRLAPKASR